MTATARATASSLPALPRAVVHPPKTAGGAQVRGIVREEPKFGGEEVTRLDPGTEVGIVERLPGGWCKIRWPYPDGTQEGYIHQDVLRL